MSATESNSVDSVITSIIDNLKQVPLAAIPAVLDCILASTGVSPSSLFFSLLGSFPSLLKDIVEGDQKLDHGQSNHVMSIFCALCHVLKNLGTSHDAMKLFIWKCLIQFLKMVGVSDHGILNQIAEPFFDVISATRSWYILEVTLVPFFLRSLGYSLIMLQNEESDIFEWGKLLDSLDLDDLIIDFGLDKESLLSLSSSFPFPISCRILAMTLDDALQNSHTSSIDGSMLENGCCGAEKLFANLLWVLCNLSEILLLRNLEHRSCTISLLLPVLFKAFASHQSLKISVHGRRCILSRTTFLRKIWKCCRSLFSLGDSERRDAYCVLSLYVSFFHCTEGGVSADASCGVEKFDIKAEREFWDEIKRGLVDEEGLMRKQSLHILKAVLHISGGSQCYSLVQEKKSQEKHPISRGITKSEIWANKEAQSLGVGKLCSPVNSSLDSQQQWEAFMLLYEMLEEYGTHLVEAAWNHQISLLLQFSLLHGSFVSSICEAYQNHIEALGETFNWLTILWQRGFCHKNPQVRCLIMESFLGIEWAKYGDCTSSVPECFVLGPFMEGLNDPAHHKDFGVKGIYTSRAIEGAVQFLHHYATNLNGRKGIDFLVSLASVAKLRSFGRVGLMGLAECIASAACGVGLCEGNEPERTEEVLPNGAQMEFFPEHFPHNGKTCLLDALRFVVESSKQHFNPNYRLRVCEKVLEAATLVICASDVPLENLLHFVDTFPREFTDCGGSLRERTQAWVWGYGKECSSSGCYNVKSSILKELLDFPESFTSSHLITFDDEDLNAWESEANRWTRVLFLAIKEDHQLIPLFTFFQSCGVNICRETTERSTVKFLILTISLLVELNLLQHKAAESGIRMRLKSETGFLEGVDGLGYAEASAFDQKFSESFLPILDNLVCLANISSAVFWSGFRKETTLPNSVRGKLGGPSQRRLSSLTTTAVLHGITSMRAVSSVSSWCAPFKSDAQLTCGWAFMSEFFWKTVTSPTCNSETGAEILLAAYEALAPVLRALASSFSPLTLDLLRQNQKLLASTVKAKPCLDLLVLSFLQNINNLLAVGVLARTRRAVLLNWKWLCLESLLSIPYNALQNGLQLEAGSSFFSDSVIRDIFYDLVESLENAGEGTVLVMLRSVRLVLRLFDSGKCGTLVSSCNGVDAQMMWHLVHSCWILHVSCNKRRVACIAALLSSVLHPSVFSDGSMHGTSSAPGPLKWFIENVLEEGTKSPRTIRLGALHLTGMFLSHPKKIKNYLKELKLLTFYGSVAFDEDFEAELVDNLDARTEVSLLAKSPDAELTEVFIVTTAHIVANMSDESKFISSLHALAFINTELYARVSVAVLFSKLADLANLVGSADANEDCLAALESGKLFLLDLLSSVIQRKVVSTYFPQEEERVVNDKDLAKELYKKYSGIHRRKIRVWQMICVLSRFVTEDIVEHVTNSLHICLYRSNLPAVRQYLETFAINIYLKFPSLLNVYQLVQGWLNKLSQKMWCLVVPLSIPHKVREQLVSILQDYDMRPQALSSYVFIAANVILHASKAVQSDHLDELMPPIIPLLTSHHHSLRGFTQLLVYQVLCKFFPYLDYGASETMPIEKRCFEDLKSYLARNPDCKRLRASMEGYLDAYSPVLSSTPAGIFVNRVEDLEFECVPTSLMEEVLNFLNDVREDLRCSMAKGTVTIKNQSLQINEDPNNRAVFPGAQAQKEMPWDFQKKITVSKHDKQYGDTGCRFKNNETYSQLLEMEKEDELLEQSIHSRSLILERIRASRQDFILVASFLDRIPNLAGLARTCEVFKASGLVIADKSVLRDKQFQLISVTAEKWVPILEVPVNSVNHFLEKKKQEGFSILGLEQTANSIPLDEYVFPKKTVLVLGREKEGIPVDTIHILDACIEIPQLGVVRSLNVHVSGAIALWEYTRQQRSC